MAKQAINKLVVLGSQFDRARSSENPDAAWTEILEQSPLGVKLDGSAESVRFIRDELLDIDPVRAREIIRRHIAQRPTQAVDAFAQSKSKRDEAVATGAIKFLSDVSPDMLPEQLRPLLSPVIASQIVDDRMSAFVSLYEAGATTLEGRKKYFGKFDHAIRTYDVQAGALREQIESTTGEAQDKLLSRLSEIEAAKFMTQRDRQFAEKMLASFASRTQTLVDAGVKPTLKKVLSAELGASLNLFESLYETQEPGIKAVAMGTLTKTFAEVQRRLDTAQKVGSYKDLLGNDRISLQFEGEEKPKALGMQEALSGALTTTVKSAIAEGLSPASQALLVSGMLLSRGMPVLKRAKIGGMHPGLVGLPAAMQIARMLSGAGPYGWKDKLEGEIAASHSQSLHDIDKFLRQEIDAGNVDESTAFTLEALVGSKSDRLARNLEQLRLSSTEPKELAISVQDQATMPEVLVNMGLNWTSPETLKKIDEFKRNHPFGKYTELASGVVGDILESMYWKEVPSLRNLRKQNILTHVLVGGAAAMSSRDVADAFDRNKGDLVAALLEAVPAALKKFVDYSVRAGRRHADEALAALNSGDVNSFIGASLDEAANAFLGRDVLRSLEYMSRVAYSPNNGVILRFMSDAAVTGEYAKYVLTGNKDSRRFVFGRHADSAATKNFNRMMRQAKESLQIWSHPSMMSVAEDDFRKLELSDARYVSPEFLEPLLESRERVQQNEIAKDLYAKEHPTHANFLRAADWFYSKASSLGTTLKNIVGAGTQQWLKDRAERTLDFYQLARDDPDMSIAYWKSQAMKNPLRHFAKPIAWTPQEAAAWHKKIRNQYDVPARSGLVEWDRISTPEIAAKKGVKPYTFGEMAILERRLANRYRLIRYAEKYAQDAVFATYGDQARNMDPKNLSAAMYNSLFGKQGLFSEDKLGKGVAKSFLYDHLVSGGVDAEIGKKWVPRFKNGISPMLLLLDRTPGGDRFSSVKFRGDYRSKKLLAELRGRYKFIGPELNRFVSEDPTAFVYSLRDFGDNATSRRLKDYKSQVNRLQLFVSKNPKVRQFIEANIKDPSFRLGAGGAWEHVVGRLVSNPTELAQSLDGMLHEKSWQLQKDAYRLFSGIPKLPYTTTEPYVVRREIRPGKPIAHSAPSDREIRESRPHIVNIYGERDVVVRPENSMLASEFLNPEAWTTPQKIYLEMAKARIKEYKDKLQRYMQGDTSAMTEREMYDLATSLGPDKPLFSDIPRSKEFMERIKAPDVIPDPPKRRTVTPVTYRRRPDPRYVPMSRGHAGLIVGEPVGNPDIVDEIATRKKQEAADEKWQEEMLKWKKSFAPISVYRSMVLRQHLAETNRQRVDEATRRVILGSPNPVERVTRSMYDVGNAAAAFQGRAAGSPIRFRKPTTTPPSPPPASMVRPQATSTPPAQNVPKPDVRPMGAKDQQSSTLIPRSKNTTDMKTDAGRDFGQSLVGTLNTRKTEWIGKPNYRRTNRLGPLFQTRQT